MEKSLYGFNSSQDVINLQTKYSLFGRVANIVFSTEVKSGFDKETMTEAINLVIERNDCLSLRFVRKGKEILQYFEHGRKMGQIPETVFKSNSQKSRFLKGFRRGGLRIFKGEVIKVVFARETSGVQSIYFKISHYVADTYAIGLIISDLFKVYDALKNGKELPPEPGKFETVLQKDLSYKANDVLRKKDEDFFRDYYEVRHPEHPTYCGLHGNNSDRWMKEKKKGRFSLPYLFVRCDTEGYRFVIPGTVGARVNQWCMDNGITPSAFYFTTCNIAASLINDREEKLAPLMLLDCRGTVAERKCGGTKVQCISVYVSIDYSRSFLENMKDTFENQNELYKHTRLSYLEVEALQHKLWNYSMLRQISNFSFSYIPFDTPQGVDFQIHSNGKGALAAYIAIMARPSSDEVEVVYDVQKLMINGTQLAEFQNTYVHVIESVLSNPHKPLKEIF